jgi:hypothetical protein
MFNSFKIAPNVSGFMSWHIYFRLPTTEAKLITKSSLLVLMFKDAGQAEANAWISF